MEVEQLMTRDVKVCTDADMLDRAARLISEVLLTIASRSSVRMAFARSLIGVVTARDITIAASTQARLLAEQQDNQALRVALEREQGFRATIEHSRSWRWTAPFRQMLAWFSND